MKIEISLSSPELHSRVIQALSDAQLLDKVDLRTLPESDQEKSLPLRGLTTVHTVPLELRPYSNTLQCSGCGRRIPLTPEGEIDLEQLELEMLAH